MTAEGIETTDVTVRGVASDAERRVRDSVAAAMRLVGPPDAGSASNLE